MNYITDDDYKLVIGSKALETISQVSSDIREMAENEAVEEMSSYLRARYDVAKIFSKTGTDRNSQLVMYGCDIALFHMSASLPQRLGSEVRADRYRAALTWLQSVADGKVMPDLPADATKTEESSAPLIIHSDPKLNNNW